MNQNFKVKSTLIINSLISKIQIIFGILLIIIFGGTFLYILFDDSNRTKSILITFFVITTISIIILMLGLKRGKLIRLFKSYVPRLTADPNRSIDQLASATGTSVNIVKRNLDEMIKRGFFINTYIDNKTNCVVFSEDNSSNLTVSAKPEYTNVTCKSCGASNKILIGSVAECEFCGSMINSKNENV